MMHAFRWVKTNLFPTPFQALVTIVLAVGCYYVLAKFLQWSFFDAVFLASGVQECNAKGDGACWALIIEKFEFILFGFYPPEERWRCWAVLGLYFAGFAYSGWKENWRPSLVLVWFLIGLLSILILRGGFLTLTGVETKSWSGLILSMVIALTSIIFSYPLGVLLALARNSKLPAIKGVSSIFIELMRGIPFITVLFMASFMLPLFLPPGFEIPKLARTIVAGTFFSGAYLAETFRGGLASVPRGHIEAGESLGLGYWKVTGFIVLPQALTVVIQPTVGSFIALFIDTSLIIIISMFDFLGTARLAIRELNWLGLNLEIYTFTAIVYFLFCYIMTKYSRRLEKEITAKKQH